MRIRALARHLTADAGSEREAAVRLFDFVRDEIPYRFGPWGLCASETLARGEGSCTNKANLLVALLRAAGTAAAYRRAARRHAALLRPDRTRLPHASRVAKLSPRPRRRACRRALAQVRSLDRPRPREPDVALLPADPADRLGDR